MFSRSFTLLQQEGYLTRSALMSGLDNLRRANIWDVQKGLFYSGWFQLANGVERISKIALLIDHMIDNDMSPLSDRELKSIYGHRLTMLYDACQQAAERKWSYMYEFFPFLLLDRRTVLKRKRWEESS